MMCCDTVHKIVRSDTVKSVMLECRQQGREWFQDNCRRELAGAIVMTSYNNKTYKVDDIIFDKTPRTYEFERRGEMINLMRYYKEHHDITITDPNQPLVQCLPDARDRRAGRTEPIILVPELCQMTGLTESLRSNAELKKQLTQMTQDPPQRRVQKLREFIQTMNAKPEVQAEMNQWQLRFDANLVEVQGRILAEERIYMKDDTEKTCSRYEQRGGDFFPQIRSKQMRVPPPDLKRWMIIHSPRDQNMVHDFMSTLNRVCRPMGIILDKPRINAIDNDRTGTFVDACKGVPDSCQLVVVILPTRSKDRYDAIKKIFCIEKPMPSQCVVSSTLTRQSYKMPTICTKIGIQIGAKMGGEPWSLVIPVSTLVFRCSLLIKCDLQTAEEADGGWLRHSP